MDNQLLPEPLSLVLALRSPAHARTFNFFFFFFLLLGRLYFTFSCRIFQSKWETETEVQEGGWCCPFRKFSGRADSILHFLSALAEHNSTPSTNGRNGSLPSHDDSSRPLLFSTGRNTDYIVVCRKGFIRPHARMHSFCHRCD